MKTAHRITEKQRIGNLGESLASRFLMKRGFSVIERNYRKKWGEIDVIAKKSNIIHFVEVKTVTRETSDRVTHETGGRAKGALASFFLGFLPEAYRYRLTDISDREVDTVTHETAFYRPEDNLHSFKLQRLERTILTYLSEKGISEESNWTFDAITIRLDEKQKTADIEFLEDITL